MASPDYNRPNNLNWILAGALILIGVFTISALVIVKSKTSDETPFNGAIGNSAPEFVGTVHVCDSAYDMTCAANTITVSPFGYKMFYATALVQDAQTLEDVNQDISSVTAVLYNIDESKDKTCSADANNCLTAALASGTCTIKYTVGGGNETSISCGFAAPTKAGVAFYMLPGNYGVYMEVKDKSNAAVDKTITTVTNSTNLGIHVPLNLSFGTLASGAASTASTEFVPENGSNGQVMISDKFTGDWACTVNAMIPSTTHYDTTDGAYASMAAALSTSSTDTGLRLARSTDGTYPTDTLYFRQQITAKTTGGISGECTNTLVSDASRTGSL